MTRERVHYGYEATITTTEGLSHICIRKDLEQIKTEAVLASLLWNEIADYDISDWAIPGVRLIRIYRITGFPAAGPEERNLIYRDCIGYCFNGKYYPRALWSRLKDWYAAMPDRLVKRLHISEYILNHIQQMLKIYAKGKNPATISLIFPPADSFSWYALELDLNAYIHITKGG